MSYTVIMFRFLKYPLVLNKKMNIIYFLTSFVLYYIIGRLYINGSLLVRNAAEWARDHISVYLKIVPSFKLMFEYLENSNQADGIGLVTLCFVLMLIILLLTFLQMSIFRKETFQSGHQSFFGKIDKIGWRNFLILFSILLIIYSANLISFSPDYKFLGLQNGDIARSPLMLAIEVFFHHVFLFFILLIIFVVPFIYVPYKKFFS